MDEFRRELLNLHRKQIKDMRHSHDLMRQGRFEVRSWIDGQWVDQNDEIIARDEQIIVQLEALIKRIESEQS
jgi:hypothetical protein